MLTVAGAHDEPVEPREYNKLCKAPLECAWPRERIIPQKQHELYAPLPLWLLSRPEATPGEKLVYARLVFFAGNHGVVWASHSTIANQVGISRSRRSSNIVNFPRESPSYRAGRNWKGRR